MTAHKNYTASFTKKDFDRIAKRKIELVMNFANWHDIEKEVYGTDEILKENSDSQYLRKMLNIEDKAMF